MKKPYLIITRILAISLVLTGGFTSLALIQNRISSPNQADAIVAYWSFDEGVGETAFDSGPNNNHGFINGSIWTDEAISGNALSFDGIDDYVRIPDSETLNTHDGFSIELWLKADSFSGDGGSSGNPLVCKWTIWAEGEYHFTAFSGGSIRFYLADGITQWSMVASNVLDTSRWHHAIVTWDGSNAKIYVDAEIVRTGTTPFDTLYTEEHPTDYIQIGHDTGGTVWNFDGILDEVKIYNRALTSQEIYTIYFGEPTITTTPTNPITTNPITTNPITTEPTEEVNKTTLIPIDLSYTLLGLFTATLTIFLIKRRKKQN